MEEDNMDSMIDETPQGDSVQAEEDAAINNEVSGVLGIDLGTSSAVEAFIDLKTMKPDILRNDLAHQKTPSIISFHDGTRSFGDAARQFMTSYRNSTFNQLIKMIGQTNKDTFLKEAPFFPAKDSASIADDSLLFSFESGDVAYNLKPEQILAMFLTKLSSFCENSPNKLVSIVVPETFDKKHVELVVLAARISGLNLKEVIYRTTAAAISNATRKPVENLDGKNVMYVDIGDGFGSIAVYSHQQKSVSHVTSKCSSSIGSRFLDDIIFRSLLEETKEKFSVSSLNAKGELRLLGAARKLKETLSGVTEAQATCENLLDGKDVGFKFTRERLEAACSELKQKIASMVEECVKETQERGLKIDQVELIGGGMRPPFVKEAILTGLEATGEVLELQYTLDSMASNCTGAGYSLIKKLEPEGGITRPIFATIAFSGDGFGVFQIKDEEFIFDESILNEYRTLHETLKAEDEKIRRTHEAKNKLESFIFDMKSTAGGGRKFTELIKKDECLELLNAADEWLWRLEEETYEQFENKLNELKKNLEPSCGEYFKKVEEDERRKERELEELSKQAAEELERSGGKDDHDFRKLSKADRMKKAVMNKEEGTSLFKDGNFEPASLRYKRALQHCDKFFDLSEEDKKEVKALKNSLHMNLSMCHIKLDNHDLALESLNIVLEDDKQNVKALYRRAVVHEARKDFDKAKKDLLKAQEHDAEDKAVQRMLQKIDLHLKKQKEKQKKMAQKMFG